MEETNDSGSDNDRDCCFLLCPLLFHPANRRDALVEPLPAARSIPVSNVPIQNDLQSERIGHADELNGTTAPATLTSIPKTPKEPGDITTGDDNAYSPPPDDLLSKIVAIDCGMVNLSFDQWDAKTSKHQKKKKRKKKSLKMARTLEELGVALRRVCIVNGWGQTLMDETVQVPRPTAKPNSNIVDQGTNDYTTPAVALRLFHMLPRVNSSGDDLNVGMTPQDAKAQAALHLQDKIVVAHGVWNDLLALDLVDAVEAHRIRDTTQYPKFQIKDTGKPHSLRYLVRTFLGRDIQVDGEFHACQEDAVGAMDLYKLVWKEWEASLAATPTTLLPRANMESNGKYKARNISQDSKMKIKTAKNGTKKSTPKRKRKKKQKTTTKRHTPQRRGILSVVFFPVIFLFNVIRDAAFLFLEGSLRIWIIGRKKILGIQPPSRNARRKRQKRRPWFNWIDSSILVTHSLIEVSTVLVYPIGLYDSSRREDLNEGGSLDNYSDLDLLHRGAVVVAVVGLSILETKQRNTLQSKLCYGALSYYQTTMHWDEMSSCLSWPWVLMFWNQFTRNSAILYSCLLEWSKAIVATDDVWRALGTESLFTASDTDEITELASSLLTALRLTISVWFALRVVI